MRPGGDVMGRFIISRCGSMAAITLVAALLAASPAAARGSAASGAVPAGNGMAGESRLLSPRVVTQTPTMSLCPQGLSKEPGAHFQVWACNSTGAAAAEKRPWRSQKLNTSR
jgi:hypothetical protein